VIWPDGSASDWEDLPADGQYDLWRDGTGLALR
jgi:hypothetical protein